MSNKIVCIREALYSAIRSVCSVSWLFARAPGHDFTRNGKLPLEKLITFILSLKGGPLASELMDHFGCSADIASVPAFVKRRGRLLPEAFSFLFHLFVERTQLSTLFHGFRLLAVDGSDLHIPTDPDDTDSFFPGKDDSKPYNLLHLDALYDLMSHTYLDASVSPKRLSDECRALCDMVDRADLSHPAIILADRGYESYNVLAHILQKGWKFLIRVKNGVGGIVSGLPIPNSEEFGIQVLPVSKLIRPKLWHWLRHFSRYSHLTPFLIFSPLKIESLSPFRLFNSISVLSVSNCLTTPSKLSSRILIFPLTNSNNSMPCAGALKPLSGNSNTQLACCIFTQKRRSTYTRKSLPDLSCTTFPN